MEFRETTQEDYDYAQDHSVSDPEKNHPEQAEYLYTLEHDGFPLMVGGFRMINATTAWCYVDLTDRAGLHVIELYRTMRDWINVWAKDHKVKRLQAYVRTDFPEGVRLVEHLGFERESIMKNFIGDKDATMYRRII
jgi:hypothetical protein